MNKLVFFVLLINILHPNIPKILFKVQITCNYCIPKKIHNIKKRQVELFKNSIKTPLTRSKNQRFDRRLNNLQRT